MKQTAVEWLKGVIDSFGNKHELQMSWSTLDEIIDQAKEMEKEQHLNTWWHGISENEPIVFEQYWQETYGGKNEI
jgi:hypothetical protein